MRRLAIILSLVVFGTICVYAGKTVFSTHAVKELKTIDETFTGARKLFVTNGWNKVVITLERTYPSYNETNETFKIEGYRQEGTLTE